MNKATVPDLLIRAVQVDQLLSPSCKRSSGSVLFTGSAGEMTSRWSRESVCLRLLQASTPGPSSAEGKIQIQFVFLCKCRHASCRPTFLFAHTHTHTHTHNSQQPTGSSSSRLAGSCPWHSAAVCASGSQSRVWGARGLATGSQLKINKTQTKCWFNVDG